MPIIQHFEVEGRSYGTAERRLTRRFNQKPFGVAFFCPHCGRIWAKCRVEGMPYMVSVGPCRNCGQIGMLDVPGSLYRQLDDEFNEAMPLELLKEEFELAAAFAEYISGLGWNHTVSLSDATHGVIPASA